MSVLRNFFLKIIRDNKVVNWAGRRVVKVLVKLKVLNKLASIYRVYGIVEIQVCDVKFKIYSKADDHIATDLYYDRGYENSEFRLLKQLLSHSKHLVDVGSNTGIFSIYAATLKSELNVLSFEPHPSNHQRLVTNITINNLKNIKAYDMAMGSSNMVIEFTVPADRSISTTASVNEGFTRNFHRIDYVKIPVRQRKLDDMLDKVPLTWKDVVKIDVEYYELEVLKGAEATLRNKRPLIILELLNYDALVAQFPGMAGNLATTHANDVIKFLTDLGYDTYAIGADRLYEGAPAGNCRNFLCVPYKLSNVNIAFEKLPSILAESLK